ncbi:hypothetical protein BB561_000641 [Smittium simulii]|uniref:Uncharacterized protein n=1 Tax=Smittium simulii TaxID=133385 RepID=A0A2T9YYC0_9FUNG|nr:hypothetical protein BB561_000641 [Smittium simulii]
MINQEKDEQSSKDWNMIEDWLSSQCNQHHIAKFNRNERNYSLLLECKEISEKINVLSKIYSKLLENETDELGKASK